MLSGYTRYVRACPGPKRLHSISGLAPRSRQIKKRLQLVPAVFKDAFDLFLAPPPPGVWGSVRTVIFLRESGIVGRFRPGSGVRRSFVFDVGPKRKWFVFSAYGNDRADAPCLVPLLVLSGTSGDCPARQNSHPSTCYKSPEAHYGEGFETETPFVGAVSLRFCRFCCFW